MVTFNLIKLLAVNPMKFLYELEAHNQGRVFPRKLGRVRYEIR